MSDAEHAYLASLLRKARGDTREEEIAQEQALILTDGSLAPHPWCGAGGLRGWDKRTDRRRTPRSLQPNRGARKRCALAVQIGSTPVRPGCKYRPLSHADGGSSGLPPTAQLLLSSASLSLRTSSWVSRIAFIASSSESLLKGLSRSCGIIPLWIIKPLTWPDSLTVKVASSAITTSGVPISALVSALSSRWLTANPLTGSETI